ncbi:MAG TPA: hypothetical protein VE871_10385 [Longimicrobium sp.]|nr:hypothetical protein [Longimicrobium sp.]
MKSIQLNVDNLTVHSFMTTKATFRAAENAFARTDYCTQLTSAVSETNGVYNCKSCGPCCTP